MIKLLSKIFIKNSADTDNPQVRHAYGIMMSVIGIVTNIALSAVKLVFGMLCGSISVTADAMNNLSDAGSQIISFISFKISAKPADRDHPFGHARIEYVASMIVSFLVLLVSVELMKESVSKIIDPVRSEYSVPLMTVLALSVAVKLWLGLSGKKMAKKIGSSVVRATASDSISDALATSAVLISAIVGYFTDIQTDAYMGVAVSVVIFIAGIKILNETKNSILGSPPEPQVVDDILRISLECPEILGIHDLVVHNYGPGNTIASLHAEVDGSKDVFLIHDMIDNTEKRLYQELGVRATVHMDPIVTDDERVSELRSLTLEAVKSVDSRFSIHDFRFVDGVTHSNLIFDITVPFEVKATDSEICDRVKDKIKSINPSFCAVITVDRQ